ncbi:PaaI family thioesterase [Roseomonas xinghualingensis]|uniref:PaaI family thioesterase n=1 Tax=Roseomonas xinghualingensis TaxID=2986475 RepID=UPI0021F231FC|nr:PaaI family thioesterase [Roseomonas sp. SXEYE001]MCV4210112.1 PaaI family thioesterase [Roseomonas sp. SXEYE001]
MTPEELTDRVRAGVPLAAALGIEVLRAAPDTALLRLPPSALSLRPGETASGPALMTLADVAIWVPLLVATGGADDTRTAQLQISFLRPAGNDGVLAEVRIVRQGRSSLYAEVWMRAEGQEKPCAHATSTWLRAPAG